MRKSIIYSQNFIKNEELVEKLISISSISKTDVVLEIGAGKGIITSSLANKVKELIAYELDTELSNKLLQQYIEVKNVKIINKDFNSESIPNYPFKVFSNIPFNITSTIIKRLTESDYLQDAYLIVQKEAALKFIGRPHDKTNSQVSVLIKPLFELNILYRFSKNDFIPKPNVDIVLLRISKIVNPVINRKDKNIFQDFVVYAFNQFKPNIIEGLTPLMGKGTLLSLSKTLKFSQNSKPSQLEFNQWIGLFNHFVGNYRGNSGLITGSYERLKKQQEKLEKINRTRVDRNWRNYKK